MNQMSIIYSLKKANQKENISVIWVSAILIALVLLLSVCIMTIGNTNYSLKEVITILSEPGTTGSSYTIKSLRLPKLIVGGIVGMGFGMAGYTFQNLLRNPLASPDVIGVSAGSSAAAVFCLLILHLSGSIVSVISILFGLLTTMFIFCLAGKNGALENRMILIGIGVQAFLNALISWMLLIGSEYDVGTAMRWLRGSLNQVTVKDVRPALVCFLIGFTGLLLIQNSLKIMALGEDYAISLGVNTGKIRKLALCFALLLCASATSITGPIASVAFLSAPIASHFISKSRSSLIQSGMVGILLVLSGELLGQNAFTSRYPVGVITGLWGAPYLLYLLYRMNRSGGTNR